VRWGVRSHFDTRGDCCYGTFHISSWESSTYVKRELILLASYQLQNDLLVWHFPSWSSWSRLLLPVDLGGSEERLQHPSNHMCVETLMVCYTHDPWGLQRPSTVRRVCDRVCCSTNIPHLLAWLDSTHIDTTSWSLTTAPHRYLLVSQFLFLLSQLLLFSGSNE
jgi:hypothetical protein